MEKKSLIGLKVLGWLLIIGIISIYSYIKVLTAPTGISDAVEKWNSMNINYTSFSYTLIMVVGIGASIISFIAGILILKLKEIGRKLDIYSSGAFILYGLCVTTYHLIRKSDMSVIIPFQFSLMFYIVFIYYLTRPKVKEQFK